MWRDSTSYARLPHARPSLHEATPSNAKDKRERERERARQSTSTFIYCGQMSGNTPSLRCTCVCGERTAGRSSEFRLWSHENPSYPFSPGHLVSIFVHHAWCSFSARALSPTFRFSPHSRSPAFSGSEGIIVILFGENNLAGIQTVHLCVGGVVSLDFSVSSRDVGIPS